jgi:hypothetical protein
MCRPQYGRFINSPLYDAGLREKSNTPVRIEIKITPKANILKMLLT